MTLAARAVSHRFADAPVLRDVSVALPAGRVTALLGPNGAGKSTLLRVLAGVLAPDAGEVTLDGRPLAALAPAARARAVALVAGAPDLAFAWTALEVVLMGRAPSLGRRLLEGPEDVALAAEALARVDAAHLADRAVTTLSDGERQRVLVARALCQDTPAVLLDEPTSHLDPAHALRMAALLRELAAEGRAVGCVLHDLNLAARAADHLVFLAGGAVVAEGPPAGILVPATVEAVYGVASRRVEGDPPAILLGDG